MSSHQRTTVNGSPNYKQGGSAMMGASSGSGLQTNQLNVMRKLHSIDEAWNLPIPAELTSRRRVGQARVLRKQ